MKNKLKKAMQKHLRTGAFGLALAAALPGFAHAENITFAVIGPHEYDLPVGFKPFDVFVQYGQYNSTSQAFNSNGQIVSAPHQNLAVGLSKYVHFWTFSEIPTIGFAYEFIVPEVHISTTGAASDVNGIGDTLTGPAVWYKPTANTTLGFQSFFTAPIGTSQVTNHYFSNYSSIFYDYQGTWFDVTGNTGGVFRTDQRGVGLISTGEGVTFHTNLRVGIKNSTPVEPFGAIDFDTTGSNTIRSTGLNVPNSSQRDLALGAGAVFTMSPTVNLTLRYTRSVAGYNEYLTNAGYLKFVVVF